jgi:transcriptional regulator with XRE-family HTH domain
LLSTVRAYFGLAQVELARLLGVDQPQLAKAEAGTRELPAAAHYRLRGLTPLLQAPEPTPPPPDAAALQARRAACLAQARRLQLRLDEELPARAAPALRRLAAAETLPAALLARQPDAPLTERQLREQQWQLQQLPVQARHELAERSGPTPTALLRARLAGLRAEAAALAEILGE